MNKYTKFDQLLDILYIKLNFKIENYSEEEVNIVNYFVKYNIDLNMKIVYGSYLGKDGIIFNVYQLIINNKSFIILDSINEDRY